MNKDRLRRDIAAIESYQKDARTLLLASAPNTVQDYAAMRITWTLQAIEKLKRDLEL